MVAEDTHLNRGALISIEILPHTGNHCTPADV